MKTCEHDHLVSVVATLNHNIGEARKVMSPQDQLRCFGSVAMEGEKRGENDLKALDAAEDMRLAMAVAKKIDHAAGMTDEQLRDDPFVRWVACLFDARARRALASVSPAKEG